MLYAYGRKQKNANPSVLRVSGDIVSPRTDIYCIIIIIIIVIIYYGLRWKRFFENISPKN